ncbi:MAG: hypothetical protein KatS3mg121_0238 [Gammaproteobacteria bacterium]|nr:MAG: hypothetical protein KatS3mg121_0238 [Gammaproteobacteria bacterium]
MAGSSFGVLFRVTTFGESHGPALGCVVDGCRPAWRLSEADIQADWTAAGRGSRATPRSGASPTGCASSRACYEGVTTGTPIALLIENVDARSKDYRDDRRPLPARATPTSPT